MPISQAVIALSRPGSSVSIVLPSDVNRDDVFDFLELDHGNLVFLEKGDHVDTMVSVTSLLDVHLSDLRRLHAFCGQFSHNIIARQLREAVKHEFRGLFLAKLVREELSFRFQEELFELCEIIDGGRECFDSIASLLHGDVFGPCFGEDFAHFGN